MGVVVTAFADVVLKPVPRGKRQERLILAVNGALTERETAFLISANRAEPDWDHWITPRYPAVNWKIRNLQLLKSDNPVGHAHFLKRLHRLGQRAAFMA